LISIDEVIFITPANKEHKITLKLSHFVPPPLAVKSTIIPPIIKPEPAKVPMQYISKNKTSIIKRKLLSKKYLLSKKEDNRTKINPKKKIIKKLVKKISKKKGKAFKSQITKRKRKISKDPLASILMGSSLKQTKRSKSSSSYSDRIIKKLYGKEFYSFTATQKKFIRKNLGAIHRITQNTLTRNGYPNVSVRTKQEGVNVVTFYLHPNGDITGLKLKKSMGYAALDKNTLEVIRTAYMNYPRPTSKTKITFYVEYRLY